MAIHSYVKIWVHIIWGTLNFERILTKDLRPKLFRHIEKKADELGVHIAKLNIQPEHVHCLLSLPSDMTTSGLVKSLKGESSRWINESDLLSGKFRWQRGYGAFSVSSSQLKVVSRYIESQDEHHRRKTFMEEYREWAVKYGVLEALEQKKPLETVGFCGVEKVGDGIRTPK